MEGFHYALHVILVILVIVGVLTFVIDREADANDVIDRDADANDSS